MKVGMIPKEELEKAVEITKKYRIGKLCLVGSSLHDAEKAHDYAFADVPDGLFFMFYGEFFREMSKNVDLIDLSKAKRFKNIILKEGKLIYDKAAA